MDRFCRKDNTRKGGSQGITHKEKEKKEKICSKKKKRSLSKKTSMNKGGRMTAGPRGGNRGFRKELSKN